jgi:predicted XRE-type DNA-binding protein
MTNEQIKNEVKQAGLKLWQIADRLNLNDGNFSRKLRKELTDTEKAAIFKIIEELKAGGTID